MNSECDTVLTQPDSFGRHWVYPSEAQVRSHAKGRFPPVIWLICLWFVCVGGLEIVLGSSASLLRLTYGLLLFAAGAGLVRGTAEGAGAGGAVEMAEIFCSRTENL